MKHLKNFKSINEYLDLPGDSDPDELLKNYTKGTEYISPIIKAIRNKNTELAKSLIKEIDPVDVLFIRNGYLLKLSASYGNREIFKYLLELGKENNIQYAIGFTKGSTRVDDIKHWIETSDNIVKKKNMLDYIDSIV